MEEHEQRLLIYSQSPLGEGPLHSLLRAWGALLVDSVNGIDANRPLETGQVTSPYVEQFPHATCVRSRGGDASHLAMGIQLNGDWDADAMVSAFNSIVDDTPAGDTFNMATLPTRSAIIFSCIEFHPDVEFNTDPAKSH